MFNPSRDEVRRFFREAWGKDRAGEVLTPMESLATGWIADHPEYHEAFCAGPDDETPEYMPEGGQTNPFLHLSMHLAISEQLSIDQPPGIRAAHDRLAARLGSVHEAQHQIMECLGQTIWESQRNNAPPNSDAYLDCIRRRAT
jgi:hypothetical protein